MILNEFLVLLFKDKKFIEYLQKIAGFAGRVTGLSAVRGAARAVLDPVRHPIKFLKGSGRLSLAELKRTIGARTLLGLAKRPISTLTQLDLVGFIRHPSRSLLPLVDDAAALLQTKKVVKRTWGRLGGHIKGLFKHRSEFDRIAAGKGGDDDEKPQFKVWVDVISSAVARTMFIPLDIYKKSGDIRGWCKIQFWTSSKVYDYWPSTVKYADWKKATETMGPVDGHGFWSKFLNLTTGMRKGPNQRGYLRIGSIRESYARAIKILQTSPATKKYARYDYVKKIPKLKLRKHK